MCEKPTQQVHLPSYMKGHNVDPVVVYRAPDGTMRFPPDTTCGSTAMYDGMGYERLELRGWADVRRFESQMNKAQRSEIARRVERQQAAFEASESARRSEVRRGMEQGFQIPETEFRDGRNVPTGRMITVRLSEKGKEIMRQAMRMNDDKGGPRTYEPGFRVEAYSESRSNRDRDLRRRDQ
jgi:hypothetical protein